jgi:hypothetical protein
MPDVTAITTEIINNSVVWRKNMAGGHQGNPFKRFSEWIFQQNKD